MKSSASWVIRDRFTGRVVGETFDAGTVATVERDHAARYEAVPILEYLGELNAKIRAQST